MTEHLGSALTSSVVVVYAIEFLKSTKYFPWLSAEKTKLARLFGVVGASFSALGIHAIWSSSDHVLTITGLTAGAVAAALLSIAKQYLLQQWIYDSTTGGTNGTKPTVPAPAPAAPAGG